MIESIKRQPIDWRKSYAHVFKLSALGCAWEFLRRNPKFTDEWSTLKPAWEESLGDYGLRILRAATAEAHWSSCLWASSSSEDATAASVIWNPLSTAYTLKVVAVPLRAGFGGQILDLEFVTAEKILLIGPDGTQQLLLRDGPVSLQLDIHGASITEPVALLLDTALPEEGAETKLSLLECLRRVRISGALPTDCFAPHSYARRAALVLLALDGYLAGVPHREIACAMFGDERVARDWRGRGEHMRDTVRRAVGRGVALMNGGYQKFLR